MMVSPAASARRDGEMDLAGLVDGADVDVMGEERAGRVELLAVDAIAFAVAA